MGGKVAMWLALSRPQLVDRLLVADIAPVTYPSRFSTITGALTGLNLEEIRDRRDADKRLAAQVPDPALRDYLLQNLVRQGSTWRWRIHLGALDAGMSEILSFPEAAGRQYAGPVLFIYGTESDYVGGAHLGIIRTLFPLARLRALPGAGHWVYAEQPDAFVRALRGFLTR
jgi:pimeloyl-ACP methyl ester carboxylesterase